MVTGWNNVRLFLVLLLLFFVPTLVQAKVPDDITCSTCHTMHNSQGGLSMNATTTWALLISNCITCHTGTDGTSATNDATAGPAVMHSSFAPGNSSGSDNMLAGGSFYWVADAGGNTDNTGHNIIGLSGEDAGLGKTPPGNGAPLSSQLTCAGSNGCHGNPSVQNEVTAIKGGHHADDSTLDGSTIGKSYRFLSSIIGTEDTNWEYTYASNDHNQYKAGTTYNSTATDTITYLCARCHGIFHGSGVGSGSSPWLRHPTDIDLPSSGEYVNYVTYEVFVPVASSTGLTLVTNTVQTANNGIVTCISCHRAHGSPYDSLMRWDYRGWPGSTDPIYGCGVCHSSKD